MIQQDPSNPIFQLAADLINHTSQHVFLTGKAGTGKTTFLKHIRELTGKNTVVVAPTGVAAINAGGITMHSFFQLPRGMFIPRTMKRDGIIGFAESTDRHSLFRNIHFNANKRQLLQEMELLIIDEVSMVRCDMLDAIDTILRHFRNTPQIPFGGVQVLFIGDMFQLPPVVSHEEWSVLQEYYTSPFFFSAKVVAEIQLLYIELKKIYRQNEQQFIEVLNRVRNNVPAKSDFDFLNSRYDPGFVPPDDDHYITITTHNKKAEAINAAALAKLPGRLFSFKATILDDFSDKAFPTDVDLQLKQGAQIMFIKNDSNSERRYFNGKIAIVKSIVDDEITVSFNDGTNDLILEKETWKNIRYIYSRENDHIDEEELGSFTQYPIRLAWAITVHKSQGLSFDKAIIDAGASFAPGQVYVALSRCTSMEGLVLRSRIHPYAISTDNRILEFAQKEIEDIHQLEQTLEKEKYRHWGKTLLRIFDWSKLITALYNWMQIIPDKKLPDVQEALQLARSLMEKAKEQGEVARKFQRQLELILQQADETKDLGLLQQRMSKAIEFFSDELTTKILMPLQAHISFIHYASRLNKYKEEVKAIESLVWNQVHKLLGATYGDLRFPVDKDYSLFDPSAQKIKPKPSKKESKGSSQQVSFELFREGKTIPEIAALRNMAISTIEGHLVLFVRTGEVNAEELVPVDKLNSILKVIEQVGMESAGLVKSRLGEAFSYHEIRVAMTHFRQQHKQSV